MAGAALVQKVWATTPAETQKLACRPRTKGPRRRVGRIGDSSIRTIELDIDLLPRRMRDFIASSRHGWRRRAAGVRGRECARDLLVRPDIPSLSGGPASIQVTGTL